jgi:heme/copper-type cytochrome/quinol oxidase subunit 1
MERFVVGFIRSSLVWLGTGVLFGLAMAVVPGEAAVYRPAHMHANLLGFVSMMIFGVAYHVIPRFTGNPLHNVRFARAHLWLANLGLGGMVAAWLIRVGSPGASARLLPTAAVLSALGTGLFIYNLWRTMDGVPRPAPSGKLPVFRVPEGAGGR